ncbi:MAG: alkaline phosphatase family protein [Saprospiraceae bacterium]
MATLAKEFAVFDHWHCDVPSQTYTNRAFWHSGTAFGFVNNSPLSKWIEHDKDQPQRYNNSTLFNRLQEKDMSWNIYCDDPISLTEIVHFQALKDYHETNFHSFNQFLCPAE